MLPPMTGQVLVCIRRKLKSLLLHYRVDGEYHLLGNRERLAQLDQGSTRLCERLKLGRAGLDAEQHSECADRSRLYHPVLVAQSVQGSEVPHYPHGVACVCVGHDEGIKKSRICSVISVRPHSASNISPFKAFCGTTETGYGNHQ